MTKETKEINPSRRDFLSQATGGVVTASVMSRAVAAPLRSTATQTPAGANDRINIGFIGCGSRFHGLLGRFKERKEKLNDIEFAAVCEVWEPRAKYAQEQTGAESVYKDYREVLARKDIDAVVIVVPDHLHFKIASEACQAGKDVYLEKPMTYTIEESAQLNDIVGETKKILQVGGSGPATRLHWQVNDYIKSGKMGKILWGLISYNRNTDTGMWDYPIPGIGGTHWPDADFNEKNIEWDMWLGSAPKHPLSAERYFRWRKYWDYSGGNATDLLYHRLGAMSSMLGFEFPTRVTGAGGIYVQKDREVPDTYMTMVEYPGDYTINMVSCMGNSLSVPITVYGNWATLEILRGQAKITAESQFETAFKEANNGKTEVIIEGEESEGLTDNWINCIRSRQSPVYNVLRGYQVMTAIKLGVDSYRLGKVMAFDPATRRILDAPPVRKTYVPEGA